jgi:tRNA(fMet)-specific endonuclease VapC
LLDVKYLLDTNVCVDYLNGRFPAVTSRIHVAAPDDLCTSSIVAAELRYGADRSLHVKRNHARLDALLRELRCLAFDEAAARVFGQVRARLESRGTLVGPYDMMIAAHALAAKCTLVTDNVREFRRVRNLDIENWREARE